MLRLTNILSKELKKKSVDWENVRSILRENRDIINDYDEKSQECVLSDLFGYPGSSGANALQLTKLFLDETYYLEYIIRIRIFFIQFNSAKFGRCVSD